ncbi:MULTISPECIES: HAD family hydrolase [unclassified Streptomyces]|uniref:HAD family hydrolase n=1 Tax=unclassified Streptomyces TaxID=2593676 RepID=UPI000A1F8319|nr:HAD family phosphatase [Streptomyces sp. 13-12-16]OSP43586.1 hypothetical protein B7767_09445 [Streptomyces sp. 13-12-16]
MDDTLNDQRALRQLLSTARAVLFDFDGPVTDLFGGNPTQPVAERIKSVVRPLWGPLPQDIEECRDSHVILRLLRDAYDQPALTALGPRPLTEAEAIVTSQEYDAVASADPVPGVTAAVDALLRAKGTALAIVSNNSDGPVWEFLKRHGLQSGFGVVVGRDPHELRHMKPDPYSVKQAVAQLGLEPADCLLIGDQLTDLEAALSAGTRFLGYSRSADRAKAMSRQGAELVITSYRPLIGAADELHSSN